MLSLAELLAMSLWFTGTAVLPQVTGFWHANLALGYVRREANQIGAELTLRTAEGESPARIVELPFGK